MERKLLFRRSVLQFLFISTILFFSSAKGSSNALTCACRNGGTCATDWSGSSPTEICLCTAGFSGRLCEIKEQRCPAHLNDCANGSLCRFVNNLRECVCAPTQFGPRCELPNLCVTQSPCRNGGTCSVRVGTQALSNVSLTYTCRCPSGYEGLNCERDVNECEHNDFKTLSACIHGRCVNTPGSFRCECFPGYRGRMCEQRETLCDRLTQPCRNNGVCQTRRNGRVYCACPSAFGGEFCELPLLNQTATLEPAKATVRPPSRLPAEPVTSTALRKPDRLLTHQEQLSICDSWSCDSKINGKCDSECALMSCAYDHGECTFGMIPFGKCYEYQDKERRGERPCDQVFADGICDLHCSSQDCLFDGFDCVKDSQPATVSTFQRCNSQRCLAVYNDQVCDYECNVAECAWDGGDCGNHVLLNGHISLLLSKHGPKLEAFGRNVLLRRLSQKTNLVARSNSKFLHELNDSTVRLKVTFDRSHCQKGMPCFEDIDSLAQLLVAHLLANSDFGPAHIIDLRVVRDAESESESERASDVDRLPQNANLLADNVDVQSESDSNAALIYALLVCFVCWMLAGTSIMLAVIWQTNKRKNVARARRRVRDENQMHNRTIGDLLVDQVEPGGPNSSLCDSDDDRSSLKDFADLCPQTTTFCHCNASQLLTSQRQEFELIRKETALLCESPRRVPLFANTTDV